MNEIKPDFYDKFNCIAGACRHSCCKGWEIDVDEDSAQYYGQIAGPFGDRLRSALHCEDGVTSFVLTKDERCPLLRDDGLCDLILHLGEESLCDICALHPRFFGETENFEYAGIGLSCEEAARLLLEPDGDLMIISGEQTTSFPEFMEKEFGSRMREFRFVPYSKRKEIEKLLSIYSECEPIDDHWEVELRELKAFTEHTAEIPRREDPKREDMQPSKYDRIYQYLIYRQMDRIAEFGMEAVLSFARQGTEYIYLRDCMHPDTAEHTRRWSEQMEYSEENTELLLAGI